MHNKDGTGMRKARCHNAQPLYVFWDPAVKCKYGSANFLACQNWGCSMCGYHRFHQMKGYGRPLSCSCSYCKYWPVKFEPYNAELEKEVTGTIYEPPKVGPVLFGLTGSRTHDSEVLRLT